MKKSLLKRINSALDDRQEWATRQNTNYRARNTGIGRLSKPYKNASDVHYPLGDTFIDKIKPGYVQQLYGADTIATFVCLKPQDDTLTQAVTGWYDYQVKQRSNFERMTYIAIDQKLEQGFTPVKVYWDARLKRLAWEQVDPLHLIVPNSCQEYNQNGGTDWLVHVLHMSGAEYEANANFEQGDDFVKSITGKGNRDQSNANDKKHSVDLKEGINCSADENEIVLWEVYERDRQSHKITVETISPLLSCDEGENVVRSVFTLPYNEGCFKTGDHFPFFKLRTELKGKGHYSSRGIIEKNLPFEMSLNKNWNTIHDHMDFSSKPLFENSGASPLPNAGNWKSKPGSIMPPGLKLASLPGPPPSLREDMELIRSIAEDGAQIPNFTASEHLTGQVPKSQTATGQQLIAAQSGQGNDLRSRVFKLDLADGLILGWSLLLQYGNIEESLTYLADGQLQTLDVSALHDAYEIVPNGSADSWNKSALVQKRAGYYQTLQNNPYIDQAELTKWLLEAEDPRLVKRLFVDPQVQTKDQEEQQVLEVGMMVLGYTPQVHPSDDDKIHLAIMDQFAQDRIMRGQMTPELAKALQDHGVEHMGQLQQKKDPMLKQIESKLKPTAEILAQFAAQLQAPNVTQFPPQQTQPAAPVAAQPQGQIQ